MEHDGIIDIAARASAMNSTALRRLSVGLLFAGATMAAALVPAPSQAVNWGPLTSYYKGTQRVNASGNFYNSGATYARNNITMNDPSNDGNNVYTRTDFQFWKYDTSSCGPAGTCWISETIKSTPEYNYSNTPVALVLQRTLDTAASGARGVTDACAQMGWPVPDSCSPHAVPSFSY